MQIRSGYVETYIQSEKQNIKSEECESCSAEEIALMHWLYTDDDYILQLRKQLQDNSLYYLRLYEDGNGVIIFTGNENYKISYFKLSKNMAFMICNETSNKIKNIIAHPVSFAADDRFQGFPVSMEYRLHWKDPNAENKLPEGYKYDDIEYANDEYEIKLVKKLLEAPEIKDIWMKLHEETTGDTHA